MKLQNRAGIIKLFFLTITPLFGMISCSPPQINPRAFTLTAPTHEVSPFPLTPTPPPFSSTLTPSSSLMQSGQTQNASYYATRDARATERFVTEQAYTPPATLTPEPFPLPSFKLGYSILEGPQQGRWIFESSSETSFKVADRYPGIGKWPWSHDGLKMAVATRQNEQSVIEIIDLENDTTSTIFLPNIPDFSPNFYFRGTLHWSSDDRWLAYYESGEVGYDFVVKAWVINVATGEVTELPIGVYFSSWSYTNPDQYLFLFLDIPPRSHPEENVEGQTSLHIGQVGLEEPIYSFPDMGIENTPQFGWHILLSPDGRLAISRSSDRQAHHRIIRMFFESGSWEVVQRDPFKW